MRHHRRLEDVATEAILYLAGELASPMVEKGLNTDVVVSQSSKMAVRIVEEIVALQNAAADESDEFLRTHPAPVPTVEES